MTHWFRGRPHLKTLVPSELEQHEDSFCRVTLEAVESAPVVGPSWLKNGKTARRGATFYTSEGEGKSLRDAVGRAFVNWDIDGGGRVAVRLKPTPQQFLEALEDFHVQRADEGQWQIFRTAADHIRRALRDAYMNLDPMRATGERLDELAGVFGLGGRVGYREPPPVQVEFSLDAGRYFPVGQLRPDVIRQRLADATGIPPHSFQVHLSHGIAHGVAIDVRVTVHPHDADRVAAFGDNIRRTEIALNVQV